MGTSFTTFYNYFYTYVYFLFNRTQGDAHQNTADEVLGLLQNIATNNYYVHYFDGSDSPEHFENPVYFGKAQNFDAFCASHYSHDLFFIFFLYLFLLKTS